MQAEENNRDFRYLLHIRVGSPMDYKR